VPNAMPNSTSSMAVVRVEISDDSMRTMNVSLLMDMTI
jgi:hypothetical protein